MKRALNHLRIRIEAIRQLSQLAADDLTLMKERAATTTFEERTGSRTADRALPIILAKGPRTPEEVMGFGPVVVVHQPENGALPEGKTYAHSFGPFDTVTEALADIEESQAHGDDCYKVVIHLLDRADRRVTDPLDVQTGYLN